MMNHVVKRFLTKLNNVAEYEEQFIKPPKGYAY